jgi:TetR/AcrR family transcriptional regulator, cholesterol catabolism regulator
MRDLANAAGILPSSLYSHFASKEALADEILREYLEDFLRQCQEVEASTTAPIDRVRGLIRVSLAGADAFPAALVIFHRDLDYLASGSPPSKTRWPRATFTPMSIRSCTSGGCVTRSR